MSRPLTELLGIDVPLIQAPIGSATCPELAAAVSRSGALGMLALSWKNLPQLEREVLETRERTDRPFGVNVVLAWPQHERVVASLEAGVRVVSTFWGDPTEYVRFTHDHGGVHLHSVASPSEAEAAAEAGVDVVVAQGVEAGGHVRGDTPLAELVPVVRERVSPIPVVAAGGIATGSDAMAAVALGADGVWVGTRFLCTPEANVHPTYQAAIVGSGENDTYHGEVFTGGWPAAPHRVLRNSTVRAWLAAGRPAPGGRPGEGGIVAWGPDGTPVERYSDVIPIRGTRGDVETLALYAGVSAARVDRVQDASEIVAEFRGALARVSS